MSDGQLFLLCLAIIVSAGVIGDGLRGGKR